MENTSNSGTQNPVAINDPDIIFPEIARSFESLIGTWPTEDINKFCWDVNESQKRQEFHV